MEIQLKEGLFYETLNDAIQACDAQSFEKNLTVHLSCDLDLSVPINAPLLQQAVINLINNAIKYSEPGTRIQVQAIQSDSEIQIQVVDQGCGIDPVHFPRLFERFYRVDKGRSRKLGGTGLGLAIVKHIAQAHGGKVSVESRPGEGSTFTIHLPRKSS